MLADIAAILADTVDSPKADLRLFLAELASSHAEVRSVKSFGAFGDGVTDDTDALQAARDWLAAQTIPATLIFPAGRYIYSESPNWAVSGATILAAGMVFLRCTGAGTAVNIDGGAAPWMFRMTMGTRETPFYVEAHADALLGVSIKAMHHSHFAFRVTGGCTAGSAIQTVWCVLTTIHPGVSKNGTGALYGDWFGGSKPAYGLVMSGNSSAEPTCYCTIDNPIIDAVGIAMWIDHAVGNNIRNGALEACTTGAVQLTANASRNRFAFVDMEQNVGYDVDDSGKNNVFLCCDMGTVSNWRGIAALVIGGELYDIAVHATAFWTSFRDIYLHGTPVDTGLVTSFRGTKSQLLGKQADHRLPSRVTPAVGASPWTYANSTGDTAWVGVQGGTVSLVEYLRDNTADPVGTATDGHYWLRGGDALRITYSVAPTVVVRF
jgi:hypothetical protein